MQTIKYQNLGLVDYKKAWDYQEELFANVLEHRKQTDRQLSGYLLFCEHPHVYTLGKADTTTICLSTIRC